MPAGLAWPPPGGDSPPGGHCGGRRGQHAGAGQPRNCLPGGEQEGFEGCLSVPGRWGVVKRPYKVRVRAQDRNGNFFEAEGEEIVARCFCHEIEHLDGHLFTEHTDRLYTTEELDRMMEEQGE